MTNKMFSMFANKNKKHLKNNRKASNNKNKNKDRDSMNLKWKRVINKSHQKNKLMRMNSKWKSMKEMKQWLLSHFKAK